MKWDITENSRAGKKWGHRVDWSWTPNGGQDCISYIINKFQFSGMTNNKNLFLVHVIVQVIHTETQDPGLLPSILPSRSLVQNWNTSLSLTFPWSELSHTATLNRKGRWKIRSSRVPRKKQRPWTLNARVSYLDAHLSLAARASPLRFRSTLFSFLYRPDLRFLSHVPGTVMVSWI